jgi:hypothetical protein
MPIARWTLWKFWFGGSLILVLLGSCQKESRTHGLQTSPIGVMPANQLRGQVTGTLSQQPLAGLQVTIAEQTAITDESGMFSIAGMLSSDTFALITGEAIFPRQALLTSPINGISQIDVIEQASAFNLDFYRELARGAHSQEGNLFPLHRWTSTRPPTFYIDTNAAATAKSEISAEMIELTRQVIADVLPVLSGGHYVTPTIQVAAFTDYNFAHLPDNAIVISFDDSLYARGGIGLTITEPDFISDVGTRITKAWVFLIQREDYYAATQFSPTTLLTHELGHAFGYRHTARLPSIMSKVEAWKYHTLTEHDRQHMAIMYARPTGNTDIDNDPLHSAQQFSGMGRKRQVFFDPRPAELPHQEASPRTSIVNTFWQVNRLASEETLRDFNNILGAN